MIRNTEHAIFDRVAAGTGDVVIHLEDIEAIAGQYRDAASSPKH